MSVSVSFPTAREFWLWLARLAYRRIAQPIENAPVGIPHMRDPDSICTGFEPRKRGLDDWGDCETDGHYLCGECCHKAADTAESESVLNPNEGER